MDSAKDFMLLIEFTKQESLKFVELKFCSIFPDTVVPVLRVLTHAFQERDWCRNLSAVKRVIPLFFFFWSYKLFTLDTIVFWWLLEKEKFPMFYKKFMEGDFCVEQSTRASVAVLMDQLLEQSYNKNVKEVLSESLRRKHL